MKLKRQGTYNNFLLGFWEEKIREMWCWTHSDRRYGSLDSRSSSFSADINFVMGTAFNSDSGMISCSAYASAGVAACTLWGGISLAWSAATFASSTRIVGDLIGEQSGKWLTFCR